MSAYHSEQTVVAQVLLRSASGERVTGESAITAETLHRFAPAPAEADSAVRMFAEAGFEVGPVVGIGMSISGPRELFQRFFDVGIAAASDGGWIVEEEEEDATARRELPLARLPESLDRLVQGVSFEEPAEAVGGDSV